MSGLSSTSKAEAEDRFDEGPISSGDEPEKEVVARPFIKWAGGKHRLLPSYEALGLLPRFEGTYIEAFLGGGAAFFYLKPKKALLVDRNEDLVTTYNAVKSQVYKLIDELRAHAKAHELYGKDHYYTVRNERPTKAIERAARFIYLNRTCYNGLYRVNSSGEFNVPMGEYKNPRIVDAPGLIAASRALRHATITHGDYNEIETVAQKGDFAFFDPPYDPLDGKPSFTSYTKDDFASADQERLRDLFERLAAKGVKALVSNSDTSRIRSLYKKWTILDVAATRAINSKGTGRQTINELAIANFKPAPRRTLEAFKHPGLR